MGSGGPLPAERGEKSGEGRAISGRLVLLCFNRVK